MSARRRAVPRDRTKNRNSYRVRASWDRNPDPVVYRTPDRKRARKAFRDLLNTGAYAFLEEHVSYDEWRILDERDGAAMLAEQAAEEQLAAAGHPPTPADYRPDDSDRHRSWLAWMDARAETAAREQAEHDTRRRRLAAEAKRDARALMSPPGIVRPEHRQRARHITGAQR